MSIDVMGKCHTEEARRECVAGQKRRRRIIEIDSMARKLPAKAKEKSTFSRSQNWSILLINFSTVNNTRKNYMKKINLKQRAAAMTTAIKLNNMMRSCLPNCVRFLHKREIHSCNWWQTGRREQPTKCFQLHMSIKTWWRRANAAARTYISFANQNAIELDSKLVRNSAFCIVCMNCMCNALNYMWKS